KQKVDTHVKLPTGYHMEFGGTYEKMQSVRARLMIVVPATFFLIFLLLFTTFGNLRQAALVFTGIPAVSSGGILALFFRGMHFSMSAAGARLRAGASLPCSASRCSMASC